MNMRLLWVLLCTMCTGLAHGATMILSQSNAVGQQMGGSPIQSGSPVTPGTFGTPGGVNATPSVPSITNRPPTAEPTQTERRADPPTRITAPSAPTLPDPPNEFQEFVTQSTGRPLPLFGYQLFQDAPSTFAPVDRVPVTPDYVVGPGDEIMVRAWGQVDIDYRAVVDRNGSIYIPQVGNINVSGVRYQDLQPLLRTAIGRVFRNFELTVSMGQLRSIQVFVVGQARRPGAYTVSSLSTLVNALFASGGPSTKGSMRRIQLKRGTQVVTEFDVYDLLVRGDKSKDARLLPGDVIYIPPTGDLVAVSGSVNNPAIFELKGATTLNELIQLAGGYTTTAAGQKATVERIIDRRVRRVAEFTLDKAGLSRPLQDGDLVQIYALSPRFENAITLRGAVAAPGRYPWREGMRVADVLPTREALIVPEYWQRQNLAPRRLAAQERRDVATPERRDIEAQRRDVGISATDPRLRGEGEERLRTEVKRTYDEINWDYAVVERLNYDDLTTALIPFNLGRAVIDRDPSHNLPLRSGDVITIFSKADIQVPVAKQTKYVRVEGELLAPGVYQILPGETLRQLVSRIGGLTPSAYLYGSELTRDSVRAQQQKRLDEALDRLAQEVERTVASKATSGSETESPQAIAQQAESQRRLVERLRQVRAAGRIVLDIPPAKSELRNVPEVTLEDGDRFVVPSQPSTVTVVGAVYNQNSFIYDPSKRVSDYLAHAGGSTRDADNGRIYVVKADGSVTGRAQSVFNPFGGDRLMPGDTIVVPENLERFRLTKELKDWSQIFYQFALGVAGLKVLRDL